MHPSKDMPGESTCTTCQFSEDFSNYWTAVLYFRARNGTYKRVPQIQNVGFDGVKGGMTVYYMQDGLYNFQQTSKVTAFQPVGFPQFNDIDQLVTVLGVPHVCWRRECQNRGANEALPPTHLYLLEGSWYARSPNLGFPQGAVCGWYHGGSAIPHVSVGYYSYNCVFT